MLCEMLSVSSRIWTRVAVSISYDDNHYTTDTFSAYNLPGLRTSNVDRSNKRKWLYNNKKKARRRIYPAEDITDADYTDDIALVANTPLQSKS